MHYSSLLHSFTAVVLISLFSHTMVINILQSQLNTNIVAIEYKKLEITITEESQEGIIMN